MFNVFFPYLLFLNKVQGFSDPSQNAGSVSSPRKENLSIYKFLMKTPFVEKFHLLDFFMLILKNISLQNLYKCLSYCIPETNKKKWRKITPQRLIQARRPLASCQSIHKTVATVVVLGVSRVPPKLFKTRFPPSSEERVLEMSRRNLGSAALTSPALAFSPPSSSLLHPLDPGLYPECSCALSSHICMSGFLLLVFT